MEREYAALQSREFGAGAGFRRPVQVFAPRVTLESPALEVMTDLARTSPATIRAQAPIEGANQYMISRGVRLLLVIDDREEVLGVITATDILGEKAMRVAMDRGLKRTELAVADLMTGAAAMEVLGMAEVESAKVGHIVATLRRAGRQHALVADYDQSPGRRSIDPPIRRAMVRGIFSISQVARQLVVALQMSETAHTYAEIEAALGR